MRCGHRAEQCWRRFVRGAEEGEHKRRLDKENALVDVICSALPVCCPFMRRLCQWIACQKAHCASLLRWELRSISGLPCYSGEKIAQHPRPNESSIPDRICLEALPFVATVACPRIRILSCASASGVLAICQLLTAYSASLLRSHDLASKRGSTCTYLAKPWLGSVALFREPG